MKYDNLNEIRYDENESIKESVEKLAEHVVGHRIVDVEQIGHQLFITLDNGKRVVLTDDDDCCAYTELESFLFNVGAISHVITDVKTSNDAEVWHILADMDDVLKLNVGWSAGSGYYSYGFRIRVEDDNG